MLKVTSHQLAAALGCKERQIRKREGKTLPPALPFDRPRSYDVTRILWWVNGAERERLCRALDLDLEHLRTLHACAVVKQVPV